MDSKNLARFLGKRVELLRVQKGLTQTELAKKLKCNQCVISAWEAGKSLISTKHIYLLCEIFDISLAYFDIKTPEVDELYRRPAN